MPRSASAERGILLAVRLPTVISPMDCASENGLLVIADAAAQIAHLGDEANLHKQRRGRARLWKHVDADLGDLTFWLLRRGVDFLANHLAGGVLERSLIRAR